jgi:uncharacterized membrane protein
METLSMFIIMASALLWMFGVPIALIVIAFNLVLMRCAMEAEEIELDKEERHG